MRKTRWEKNGPKWNKKCGASGFGFLTSFPVFFSTFWSAASLRTNSPTARVARHYMHSLDNANFLPAHVPRAAHRVRRQALRVYHVLHYAANDAFRAAANRSLAVRLLPSCCRRGTRG